MNEKKERIGIFGGSFNPIHRGHIEMINLAIKELKLERLYLVPVGTPCHRCDKEFASGTHRLKMAVLASNHHPKIYPCDLEVNSKKTSYTYDTLLQISKLHPNSIIYEIIGEDSAEYLHKWKNYDKMKEICEFVYFRRHGYKSTSKDIISIEAPLFHVSSTMIREKIKNNEPLDEYLTPEVEGYIKENKLYRDTPPF